MLQFWTALVAAILGAPPLAGYFMVQWLVHPKVVSTVRLSKSRISTGEYIYYSLF